MAQNSNEDLKQICRILSVPYVPVNEETALKDQVRVIDEEEKRFLGVFSFEQALAKARSMGKELILTNGKISPPLCKIAFYRKSLYEKFVSEVILSEGDNLTRKKRVRAKVVTLKAKMTMNDARTKLNQAVDLAQKNESVRVVLSFKREDEDRARNLFSEFYQEALEKLDVVSAPCTLNRGSDIARLTPCRPPI